jgi:hypothetical protein
MWNFLFGWILGSSAGNAALPDSEKQRRRDKRQADRQAKRGRNAAVRAGWGPVQWTIVVIVAVLIVVLLYR